MSYLKLGKYCEQTSKFPLENYGCQIKENYGCGNQELKEEYTKEEEKKIAKMVHDATTPGAVSNTYCGESSQPNSMANFCFGDKNQDIATWSVDKVNPNYKKCNECCISQSELCSGDTSTALKDCHDNCGKAPTDNHSQDVANKHTQQSQQLANAAQGHENTANLAQKVSDKLKKQSNEHAVMAKSATTTHEQNMHNNEVVRLTDASKQMEQKANAHKAQALIDTKMAQTHEQIANKIKDENTNHIKEILIIIISVLGALLISYLLYKYLRK